MTAPTLPTPKSGPQIKLVKFWSNSCGICHRMSHYDQKVAAELDIEFVSVQKVDKINWKKWVHVAESLYKDPMRMGWPTYILVLHESKDNFKTLGEVLGGSDKGKFRRKIQELLESTEVPQTMPEIPRLGGNSESHCKDFDNRDCSPFRWDCTTDNATICAGENGEVPIRVSTHGCDGKCDENGGGKQLDYKWKYSKNGGGLRNLNEGPNSGGSWTFKMKWVEGWEDLKPGDYIELTCIATCPDHPDGPNKLEGGSGSSTPIKINVIQCDECNNNSDCGVCEDCVEGGQGNKKCKPRECPGGQVCCNDIDGCRECCNDNDCTGEQTCENYKCVDPVVPHECDTNADCGTCKDCEAGSGGVRKCKNRDCPNGQKCCPEVDGCRECCSDTDCGANQECVNGKCQDQEPDHECDTNADCGPCKDCEAGAQGKRRCVNRTCPDGQKCCDDKDGCRDCCNNNDCPDGWTCSDSGNCVAPHECDKNEDCGPCEKCEAGSGGVKKCKNQCPDDQRCCPELGGCRECCQDSQCPPGFECRNGNCVEKPECKGNEDCNANKCEKCEGGKCVEKCDNGQHCCKDGNGDAIGCRECCNNSHCEGDKICNDNHKCVDPTPGDPCAGVDCDAAQCLECKDGNCVSKCTGGKVCDGNGNCVDPTPTDPCDGVVCDTANCEECRDGKCVNKCPAGKECDGNGNCVDPVDPIDCGDEFKVTFTCPGNGEAGSTVTLTSSTNKGDQYVDYEWYIGSLDSPDMVSNEKTYTYTYPAAGTCESLFAYANYNPAQGACSSLDWVKCEVCGEAPSDPCAGVDCDAKQCLECKDGQCVSKCTGDKVCDGNGNCVDPTPGDPCDGVNCNAQECLECKDGQCVSKCTGGKVCDGNGNCVDPTPGDPCENVDCDAAQCLHCVNGKCESKCPDGKVCDGQGNCVDPTPGDPCDGVDCDAKQCLECKDGKCVSKCEAGKVCDGNGNCVDEPDTDCDDCDGGWVIDWGCIAKKLNLNSTQNVIFEQQNERINYLLDKLEIQEQKVSNLMQEIKDLITEED